MNGLNGLIEVLATLNLAPLLVSVGAGITAVLALSAVAVMRSPVRMSVSGRIAAIVSSGQPYQPTSNALRDRRVSRIPLLESLIGGRTWVDTNREALARADIPLRVGEYVALRVLAIAAGALLGMLVAERAGGAFLAQAFFVVLGVLGGLFAPPAILSIRRQRRQQQIESQLVELCEMMASMLQSGFGYMQALTSTAAEVGPPLSTELQALLDTVRLGGDVDEALRELDARLASRDFNMVASAIIIQRRSGGNLAEILSGVAETIRERQAFIGEVRALTSKERFSALIVAMFPLVLVVLLTWMSPEIYGLLFTDMGGRMILGAVLMLDLVGYFIIRHLSKLEV